MCPSPYILAKASRSAQPTQRMPLDILALVIKGASILECHGTVTIGKMVVAGHHHQGTTNKLNYNSCLPVEKVYLPSVELQPEGQALGFPHI